jgi:hypothetical protein
VSAIDHDFGIGHVTILLEDAEQQQCRHAVEGTI